VLSADSMTDIGIRPTHWHRSVLASKLGDLRSAGISRIMLPVLPEWKADLDCRTEEIVAMIEYLVETASPLMARFSLDMHLVDAVIQCRLRRQGLYVRSEWTGTPDP